MPDDPTNPNEWLPVAEAAAAAGVPVRSVYRWSKAKKLPTRREGGKTIVLLAEVQRLAAARDDSAATGAVPPAEFAGTPAGARADTGTMAGTVALVAPRAVPMPTSGPASDGALAQAAFALFEEGGQPMDLVRERGTLPEVALKLWTQWRSLRDAGGDKERRTVGDRLASLEKLGAALEQRLAKLEPVVGENGTLSNRMDWTEDQLSGLAALKQAQAELARLVGSLPVPRRQNCKCDSCGETGLVAVRIRCTACLHEDWWGFHAPKK